MNSEVVLGVRTRCVVCRLMLGLPVGDQVAHDGRVAGSIHQVLDVVEHLSERGTSASQDVVVQPGGTRSLPLGIGLFEYPMTGSKDVSVDDGEDEGCQEHGYYNNQSIV